MKQQDNDWSEIEARKKGLLAAVVDALTEEEYAILEATLKEESEYRHLLRPHGLKKRLQEMIERTVR